MDSGTAAPGLPDAEWQEVTVEYARHQVRVLARPSFWSCWLTILRFSKNVQKELQDFNFQINSLLNTVMSRITYNQQPGMRELLELNNKWLEFMAYYRSRSEPYLFASLPNNLESVDQSFSGLEECAGTDKFLDVVRRSQVPYRNIRLQIGECPRLINEIEGLTMQMTEGLSTGRPTPQVNRAELLSLLTNRLSDEDIRTLAFNMNVDYENLAGDTKEARAREFITLAQRGSRLGEFVRAIRVRRPDLEPALAVIAPDSLLRDVQALDLLGTTSGQRIALDLALRIQALETIVKSLVIQADSLTQHLLDTIVQKKED